MKIFIDMRKFFDLWDELSQKLEDWVFENIVPPILRVINVLLRFTLLYAFYLLFKNIIKEVT